MANYAVIENGIVNNIIVADTQEIAETVTGLTCVEYTEENPVSIGWKYDGANFTNPAIRVSEEEIPTEETPAEETPAEETPAE